MIIFIDFEIIRIISYVMPSVCTHAFVDMCSPGYLGIMSSNHNGMLRMYETFGNGGANTMKRTVGGGAEGTEAPGGGAPAGGRAGAGGGPGAPGGRGGGMTSREWYRPLPPYRNVEWSMRNNTN